MIVMAAVYYQSILSTLALRQIKDLSKSSLAKVGGGGGGFGRINAVVSRGADQWRVTPNQPSGPALDS